MPVKYTVTLTSVGSSRVIVMPKAVVEGFGLKKGQRLEMIVKDNGIHIPLGVPAIKQDKIAGDEVSE